MPDYTFAPAPVLVETTGEFAIGSLGVLRTADGADAVQVFDLNGSPITGVLVGPKGAHQAFKADIPNGVLDFGSVVIPAISHEAQTAAITLSSSVESALSQVETLQTSKAPVIHTHPAAEISDFAAAVQAVPGVGGGGGVGFIDGGTPDSSFSDVYIDGGTPDGGGGLRLVSDL